MSTGRRTDTRTSSTVRDETTSFRLGHVLLAIAAIVAVTVALAWLSSRDAGPADTPAQEGAGAAIEVQGAAVEVQGAAVEVQPVTAEPGRPAIDSIGAQVPYDLPCRPTCGSLFAVAPPSLPRDLPCTPMCSNLAAVNETGSAPYELPCRPMCGGSVRDLRPAVKPG